MIKKKRVYLRFYDSGNLGDDLFFHIVTGRYDNNFVILSRNAQQFMKSSNVTVYSSKLFVLFSRLFNRTTQIGDPLRLLLSNICDIYVYVGGSIFIENDHPRYWDQEERFYASYKKPKYIIGSNFGPHTSERFVQRVKAIIQYCTDVCFRDKVSYELFKDIPVARVSTDIAFCLDTSSMVVKDEKIAIFSLIDGMKKFDNLTTFKYEDAVRALTSQLIRDGYKVIYMSFCEYEGDEVANRRVRAALPVEISNKIEEFNYHGNLDDALSLLARSEIIIASRFHATILGLVFGKKVLPMAYSDKTTDILTDMAFPGTVVDIRKINEFDPGAFDFNTIPIMDVAEQRALAETQFQELDKVLAKKATDA